MSGITKRLIAALQSDLGKKANPYLIKTIYQASGFLFDDQRFRRIMLTPPNREIKLSSEELEALHIYFIATGRGGLNYLFDTGNLLRKATATGRVTFTIGAKPDEEAKANFMSSWDVRSCTTLIRAMSQLSLGSVHLDITDVLVTPDAVAQAANTQEIRNLIEHSASSIMSIGSHRGNPASEILLAYLFQRSGIMSDTANKNLPFRWAWQKPPRHTDAHTKSIFGSDLDALVHPSEYGETYAALQYKDGDQDEIKRILFAEKRRKEYAVIVCQQQPDNRVFLVIAGLTAPATYAAAKLLENEQFELPYAEPSPVLWAVIEANVSLSSENPLGDNREVLDQRIIKRGVWTPENF